MNQRGSANPLLFSTIMFAVLTVALAGLFVWAFMNYQDYKHNTDQKVAAAVGAAKAEQKKQDDKQFEEDYKKPYTTYRGPADLGSVSFDYPKTWSAYEASNTADNNGLQAYFHPKVVPPIDTDGQVFALKVEVKDLTYQQSLDELSGNLEEGTLKAAPYKTNGYTGMRFTGQLDESHQGVILMFKIRNQTLVITVNSNSFVKELDHTILKTLKFNP
ncbi:MAG TPA: hypothetical protein VFG56_02480 [Candidatus Saccharimonadales bacterium]|nr:hypothetical protein [Candidatus Saccharimonadales bacterium]